MVLRIFSSDTNLTTAINCGHRDIFVPKQGVLMTGEPGLATLIDSVGSGAL